jgi:hypothetical protein
MAFNIAAVGRVTVSDLKSCTRRPFVAAAAIDDHLRIL